jgi:hypothetical protein
MIHSLLQGLILEKCDAAVDTCDFVLCSVANSLQMSSALE